MLFNPLNIRHLPKITVFGFIPPNPDDCKAKVFKSCKKITHVTYKMNTLYVIASVDYNNSRWLQTL